MKNLIKRFITIFIFLGSILLSSEQALACSCEGPNFSQLDIDRAVESFMISKMKVDEIDILESKSSNQRGFIGPLIKGLGELILIFDGEDFQACVMGCGRAMNLKSDHIVEFYRGGELCKVHLQSKFTSNFSNSGFKSVVKKNKRSICK